MNDKSNQSNNSAKEMFLPILLRRRLSAPETIMRKHALAQRSESQDNEIVQSESSISHWPKSDTGSDSNLNRKRDSDILRKTSLLRRFRGHNKSVTSSSSRLSGMFYEWQNFYGKLCSETSSTHSTPEHDSRTSPLHYRRLLSTNKVYELRKGRNCKQNGDSENTDRKTSSITASLKTTTETETSPRNTTNTTYTTSSDNDSAYTNSKSNFSESLNNNSTTPSNSQKAQSSDHNSNTDIRTQENTTQTAGTTNVNVISNVKLSPSTLNLIFKEVMNDVSHSDANASNILQVKQTPSFYLINNVQRNVQSHVVKCTISNVGVGSLYTKPTEPSQMVIPRFSAKPHSASMEVNVSSGESTDRESDTLSLVDSLEDTSSLRTDPLWTDEVNIKSDISLELPDNSAVKSVKNKATAFFIPIEVEARTEFTPVSNYLPTNVRDKLAKRQQNRQKKLQNKYKLKAIRAETGNLAKNLPLPEDDNIKLKKRCNKSILPNIDMLRSSRRDDKTKHKPIKEAQKTAHRPHWIPKSKNQSEKLTPLPNSCRIYKKTERDRVPKKIEILEIMECIDDSEMLTQHLARSKSKIPVLAHKKMGNYKEEKPAFLEVDQIPMGDPKLDQLIANILIETLNIPEAHDSAQRVEDNTNETQASSKMQPKFHQKFEVIPEELSLQSAENILDGQVQNGNNDNDDVSNNNDNANDATPCRGRAGIVVSDANLSTIPNGWIALYMLHNKQESPESTSDEGKKLGKANACATQNDKIELLKSDLNVSYDQVNYDNLPNKCFTETNDQFSSSSETRTIKLSTNTNERRRKSNNLRRGKHRVAAETEHFKQTGEWSVTVSGTNSYGQFAPNLEMNLKFPETYRNYYCPSQSDSGLGEDNEQKLHFPKIVTKQAQCNKIQSECENYSEQTLPDIPRSRMRRNQRKSDSGIPTTGNSLPSRIEPRQTRTSTQRYKLSRPKLAYTKTDTPRSPIDLFSDKQYAEILRRFPEILSINGSGISQEEK